MIRVRKIHEGHERVTIDLPAIHPNSKPEHFPPCGKLPGPEFAAGAKIELVCDSVARTAARSRLCTTVAPVTIENGVIAQCGAPMVLTRLNVTAGRPREISGT